MDIFKTALEWLKTSPRYFLTLALVSGVLLFVPDNLLFIIGVSGFRRLTMPWLGLVFLFSVCVILSNLVIKAWALCSESVSNFLAARRMRKRLKRLTNKEKYVLAKYISDQTRTQYFHMEDGVVSGLVVAGLLHPAVTSADIYRFPFNMKLPVWEYLSSNQYLLAIPGSMQLEDDGKY